MTLLGLGRPGTAGAAGLEVLGGKTALAVELEGGEGSGTILVRNGGEAATTLSVSFVPAGASTAIGLPGAAGWIHLEAGRIPSRAYLKTHVLTHLIAQLKGNLLDRVRQSLPYLGQLAFGRGTAGIQLAESPSLARQVADAVRGGVGGAPDAAIRRIARRLSRVIAPRGRAVELSLTQTRAMLFPLESTLKPPGVQPVGEALEGTFVSGAIAIARSPLSLAPGEVRPLAIRFSLSPGQSPRAASGELVLSAGGEAQAVAVSAAPRQFGDVSVEPPSLSFDSGESTATVALAGPDLVEFLASGAAAAPTAILRDSSGDSGEAKLLLPSAEEVAASANPNRAEALVELTGVDAPGAYAGTVQIAGASSGGPSIQLSVSSRRGIGWLIGLAFCGVLCAGLLARLVALAMRRSLLLAALDQSMAAYRRVLGWESTAGWHLEDLLDEPSPAPAGALAAPSPPNPDRLQGVPALIDSIETARSSGDLDEDTARVLDTVARIQRWLRLEPAARRLVLVAAAAPPPSLIASGATVATRWQDSRTWRDTRILLEAAKREPADAAAADALLARLLAQIEWHHHLAEAWAAVAAAGNGDLATKLLAVDTALGEPPAVEARKPEDQDALDAKLLAFVAAELAPGGFALTEPPKPPEPPGAVGEAGVTPVKWAASPNLFTGWATLDAQSYGQLTRRAATSARALAWPDFKLELEGAFGPTAVAWTLVALALSCAAYGVDNYGATWGTHKDLASAFLAGAMGTVVVKWAALPIFRSLRLRATQAK